MAFLKKFDIKQICVVNHQDINILSNFGSRKTKNREMIGSSVKDFGSFYQKTLEPIFSKDRKTTALLLTKELVFWFLKLVQNCFLEAQYSWVALVASFLPV